MKKILSSSQWVGIISIFLCVTMICIGILSMNSNASLQGNARIINYTGIIRGGTQKLIKQELMYHPNDALIAELDSNLQGLIHGDKNKNLTSIKQKEYQAILNQMETEWQNIKEEIIQFRNGTSSERLYELSEHYFTLADKAVGVAEVYTEDNVQQSRKLMIIVMCSFIIIVILSALFIRKQQKREEKISIIEEENRKKSEQLARKAQQMLMPINEMTELMYLTDINTYDLLFVNDAGKKLFQIDDYKGLKCYKVLQGFDKPCEFCTNAKLSNDETYTWEHTNPIINRHYLLKDRLIDWEGREVRMEIAFDITDNLRKKEELESRIKKDNILVDCIRELYQNHHTVDAMNHVLKLIGEVFEAERAYVFYMENDEMSNIAEWCSQGVVPQIDNLQHLSRHDFQWWFQLYDEQASILIKDIEELKGDKQAEYELLVGQDINRLILVPLEQYGNFGGMIGLDNLAIEEFENAEKFLRTFSYFIMLAIRRNEDEKTLFQLSFVDTLTMFYNRNRYIQDIEEFSQKEGTVGVIFIDLNGLKEVNDYFGHDAGDELLKKGTKIMKTTINNGIFYRVGGDEFIIICLDVEKVEFEVMVQQMKKNLNSHECKAAVGYQWTDTCYQLKEIIIEADQNMYEDKKDYYRKHAVSGKYRH
ncbi:sensor domain-containing diguanylate cyclase [Candidatus Stoquefichus massiliensis]|uniref:sensor domain-containing diguanylate cyclase n=1 Tax=Candidatus Stoquefichus massiliensis TaxID=1470350 RepID=UPI000482C41A|nr:GGDEF domain-containing protein [Candidatus Stoquefichus massiliensis]